MNVALLFDADGAKYKGNYYWETRQIVFQTGIIQAADRHMKMSVGDVLWRRGNRTPEDHLAVLQAVFFQHRWALLHEERLRSTFGRSEVFAIVFENMTQTIAESLHAALTPDERYLGLKEVSYEFGPHLVAFRTYLGAVYRIHGRSCRAFYSMSSEDEKDQWNLEAMAELGFDDLDWEDSGARKTIFDDYDTPDHFQQMADFRDALTPYLSNGADDAAELIIMLEDLNPRLFNALGAAAQALSAAKHEEHVAQAALAGRRYLETLADSLFPPTAELYNGRSVGAAEYKNRLWAYIEKNLPPNDSRLLELGAEVDRLVSELNSGLHGDRPAERILLALKDVSILTTILLTLNMSAARKPYLGFEKSIQKFWREALSDRHSSQPTPAA